MPDSTKSMIDYKRIQNSPFFLRKRRNQQFRQQDIEIQKTEHERLSRLIKNIFYLYIFANLFCLVTLYTVSDEEIIQANAKILMPLMNIQVPYVFFVASGAMVIFSLFVYLSIRFEELDKISTSKKMPYIFNSEQRATRQLTSFILYFLGPITLLTFAEQAYLFQELDRMPAAFVFFVMLSLLTYKKRTSRHLLVGTGIVLLIGLFVYLFTMPTPVQLVANRVDLGGQNLKRVQLNGYRLDKAIFNHAQLYEASIRDSHFTAAEFWGANMARASLYQSKFTSSNAEYADFSKTILRDVVFTGCNLKQVDFSDSVIFNVTFADAEPEKTANGVIKPAEKTNLNYAKFAASRLVAVKFDGANLANAEFINTDIQKSSFKGSLLNYVDFQTATGLTCEQIKEAKSHEGIKLPYYLYDCFEDPDKKKTRNRAKKKTKTKQSKKK